MPEKGTTITLSLVTWQKQMIKDHMRRLAPAKVSVVQIPKIDKKQWVMYRQPEPAALAKGSWNLYLTDSQINKVGVRLGAGVKISALRISPEMVKSGAIVFA
jgi:hypothetical protein